MTQVRLSYAYGTSSQPLLGTTIGEKFDQACAQYAEQDAVVSLHQNVRLSYRQLQEQVNAFACSLLKLGFQKVTVLQSGRRTAWNGPLPSLRPLKPALFW